MVNHLEENGEKVSWRKGFKWGWSVSAFRLWLMDLLVILPIVFVFIVLFGCAALPVLLGITAGEATTAAGVVATIGIVIGGYVAGFHRRVGCQFMDENCTTGMCN